MESFLIHIKQFFCSLNGALLPKEHVIDDELQDVYDQVFLNDNRLGPINDKINISNDALNIKGDIKKSYQEYKSLHGHGIVEHG